MTPKHIASICHEANRALRAVLGEEPGRPWYTSPGHVKRSAIDGVLTAIEEPDMTPQQCHENWVAFKQTEGWAWGPVKSGKAKTHPLLVDYGTLPDEQKIKDVLFLAIVRALEGFIDE